MLAAGVAGGRRRGRGDPPRAVRDRPARQPHARLRGADRAAGRRPTRSSRCSPGSLVGRLGARPPRWRTLAAALAFRPLRDRAAGARRPPLRPRRASTACGCCATSSTTCATGGREPEDVGAVLALALGDPARRGRLPAARDRRLRRPRRPAARRRCPTTAARARRSARDGSACCCTTRRSSAADLLRGVLDAAARRRSRSPACASSCGCSSPRSSPRARGSPRPATRSAGGSSATCTTARSSGSSRSASCCAACSARCPREAQMLAPALDAAVDEVAARDRRPAHDRGRRAPAAARRGPRRRAATTSRAAPRSRSRSRRPATARRRRSRRPPTSSPARRSPTRSSTRRRRAWPSQTAREDGVLRLASPTTASAAPRRRRLAGSPGWPTASPPTAARSRSRARPARARGSRWSCHAGRDRRGHRAAARGARRAARGRRPRGRRPGRRRRDAARARRRARARARDRRRPHAARLRRRGHARGGRDPPLASRRPPCSCSPSTSRRRHIVELVAAGGGFGYLLKDRVLDVDDFLDAARRVADGGSALDPQVVAHADRRAAARTSALDELSPREREVLGLMAEGRTNAGHRQAAVADREDGRDARAHDPDEARAAARTATTTGACSRCSPTCANLRASTDARFGGRPDVRRAARP